MKFIELLTDPDNHPIHINLDAIATITKDGDGDTRITFFDHAEYVHVMQSYEEVISRIQKLTREDIPD